MSHNSETNKEKNIALVILAAGNSSRMKAVKQLLPWKNTTLLANAIEIGLASTVNTVWVVLGANSESIRPSINQFDINIIENENWESGLGSSISCAIQQIKQSHNHVDGVLLCLADMPFVKVSHLNKMIENYMSNKNSIIASRFKDKAMVPALFDAVYFDELINLSDEIGAKQLLQKHHHKLAFVDVKSENVLIDLDTQKEYNLFKD